MEKNKTRILYIEDYPVIQTMYVDILKSHAFTVEVASDGRAALELVSKHQYDIILLDLLLPQVTGIEFLREFRAHNYSGEVIILSDFENPQIMEEIAKLGVKYYWIKVENTPHLLAERLEHLVKDLPTAPAA